MSSTQISAWNAAGTWEERGHTIWAKARIEELVTENGTFELVGGNGIDADARVRIVGVKSCEGDASVVMIRGKPRRGFDFELTLNWEAAFASGGDDDEQDVIIKGTVHVPEFSRDGVEDEECACEVKVSDRNSEHAPRENTCVATLKKRCEDFLVRTLMTIDSELEERASK